MIISHKAFSTGFSFTRRGFGVHLSPSGGMMLIWFISSCHQKGEAAYDKEWFTLSRIRKPMSFSFLSHTHS